MLPRPLAWTMAAVGCETLIREGQVGLSCCRCCPHCQNTHPTGSGRMCWGSGALGQLPVHSSLHLGERQELAVTLGQLQAGRAWGRPGKQDRPFLLVCSLSVKYLVDLSQFNAHPLTQQLHFSETGPGWTQAPCWGCKNRNAPGPR